MSEDLSKYADISTKLIDTWVNVVTNPFDETTIYINVPDEKTLEDLAKQLNKKVDGSNNARWLTTSTARDKTKVAFFVATS